MELKYFKNAKKEATISKRYRELAMKYHPDKAKDDADKERFTRIMQEINEEHKEVLILLKYAALENKETTKVKEKVVYYERKQPKQNIIKQVAAIFNLSNEQKEYFIKQGRNTLITLYDNIIENNSK